MILDNHCFYGKNFLLLLLLLLLSLLMVIFVLGKVWSVLSLPSSDEEEARLPSEVPGGPRLQLPGPRRCRRRQPAHSDENAAVLHYHGCRQHEERTSSAHQWHLPAPTVHAFIGIAPARAHIFHRDPCHLHM